MTDWSWVPIGLVAAGLVTAPVGPAAQMGAPSDEAVAGARIVLLIDSSKSMRNQLAPARPHGGRAGRDGIFRFVDRSLGPEGAVRVATVGERFLVSPAFVRTGADLARAFAPIEQWAGPSPIWDGVYHAAGLLEPLAGPRGIVLVTDGYASANRYGLEDAQRRVSSLDLPVYIIHTNHRLDAPADHLTSMAAATGGEYAKIEFLAGSTWPRLADVLGRFLRAISAAEPRR